MGLPGVRFAGRLTGAVLGSELVQEVTRAAIRSPLVGVVADELREARILPQMVDELITDEVLDDIVARLLETEELWVLVDVVASSPAVTAAISQQGLGFADEVAGVVRGRTRTADARLETIARRALRRRRAGDGTAT